MKICNKCKENKELSAFSSNKSATDKLCPSCKACLSAYNKAYKEANKQKIADYQAEYQQQNKEKLAEYHKDWREENRERCLQTNKDYYQNTKEQFNAYYTERYKDPEIAAKVKLKAKLWREENPDKVLAQIAHRRAKKLNATPKWADSDAIRKLYKEAIRLTEETGVSYQVDHIIPLNGELVCGLHVETNLQVILATENGQKSNKFNPETFEA